MCRAYPGFRCSSHPNLIVRVVSRKIHNKEREREQALQEQEAFRRETPDWEGSKEDADFQKVVDKLQQEIAELEERRQAEMTDFYMTPAGKQALLDAIAKAEAEEKPAKKFDLESEMIAAEGRRAKQKKIAAYMANPKASTAMKIWRAKRELASAEAELKSYDERSRYLNEKLSVLEAQLREAKLAGDEEAVLDLTDEKAKVYKELSFVDKQRKHLRAHVASTASWVKKQDEAFINKIFDMTDKLAMGYIDIMFDKKKRSF